MSTVYKDRLHISHKKGDSVLVHLGGGASELELHRGDNGLSIFINGEGVFLWPEEEKKLKEALEV